MINSMTGFGSAEFRYATIKGSVDIKSVNHRYLDIAYFLPTGFVALEEKMRQVIQKQIKRGRITICLRLIHKEAPAVVFNQEVVRSYLKNEQSLKKKFNLSGHLSLTELIRLPGVVETQESIVNLENLWPYIEKGFNKALRALLSMRKREGISIEKDIKKQILCIYLGIKKIRSREKIILMQKKKELSSEDFESYQKSTDINEELARLTHHTDEYKRILKTQKVLGKKLDFIGQEMQREANTIGSKLQDKIVSSCVISLKSRIEKLREQAQNIE